MLWGWLSEPAPNALHGERPSSCPARDLAFDRDLGLVGLGYGLRMHAAAVEPADAVDQHHRGLRPGEGGVDIVVGVAVEQAAEHDFRPLVGERPVRPECAVVVTLEQPRRNRMLMAPAGRVVAWQTSTQT